MQLDEKTIELTKSAQNGNRCALAQLFQESYSTVYKYLLKFTLNEHEAQDITQDTIVKAIEKINTYNYEKSSFTTWMIAIAKNIFIDRARKQKRFEKYKTYNLPIEQLYTSLDSFLEKDVIISSINKLSPKQKAPIVLKYGLDFSYEEIANYLNIPIGTVKSRISNGMKVIREELKLYEQ